MVTKINFRELKKRYALLVLVVIVPMLIGSIYFIFFAKDRYVSRAEVVVRRAEDNSGSLPGIALLLGSTNTTSREETIFLKELIESADMLNFLQRELNWNSEYTMQWKDPFYWLSGDAPAEDVLKFYRRMVHTHYEDLTGLLSIEVQSYSREFSKKTLDAILIESERFVNDISQRMAREQMAFSRDELEKSRSDYLAKRRAMLDFQNQHMLLDAQVSATSRATIIAELDATITKESARLRSLLSSFPSHAPQVQEQKIALSALNSQLEAEKRLLVSRPDGEMLNVMAARYRSLSIDAGISEEAYKVSVTALESARIEASKKIRTLITIVGPNLPEAAIYPRRAYNIFTILIAMIMMFGIVRFLIITINDHRD